MNARRIAGGHPVGLLLPLLVAVAAGCSVKLISDYDPGTDQAVTELHRDVESLLTSLEDAVGSEKASPERYGERYEKILANVRSLRVRAGSRPKNELQVRQLAAVEEQVGLLRRAHGEGLAAEDIELFRRGFEQSFQAILKLELAKQRGEKGE